MKNLKKTVNFVAALLVVGVLTILTSCVTTTRTETPGRVYNVSDEVRIIDIETDSHLGSVTVTEVAVVYDTPFYRTVIDGVDDNGNNIEREVRYEQIVQVNFSYDIPDTTRRVRSRHFTVIDSAGEIGSVNFDDDTPFFGQNISGRRFAVALRNKSEYVMIEYRYRVMQVRPTARIFAPLAQGAGEDDTDVTDEDAIVGDNDGGGVVFRFDINMLLLAGIIVLGAVVIGLIVVVILLLRGKRGTKE